MRGVSILYLTHHLHNPLICSGVSEALALVFTQPRTWGLVNLLTALGAKLIQEARNPASVGEDSLEFYFDRSATNNYSSYFNRDRIYKY